MFPHLCASVSRLRLQKHCSRSRHLHPGPTVGGDNRDTGLCDTRLKATFRRTRRRLVFVRRRMVQGRGRFKKRENNPWSIPPPSCPTHFTPQAGWMPCSSGVLGLPIPLPVHMLSLLPSGKNPFIFPFPHTHPTLSSELLSPSSFYFSPTHSNHCSLKAFPTPDLHIFRSSLLLYPIMYLEIPH